MELADGEGTHNYVVFADVDIEIQEMLFQPEADAGSADNQGMGENKPVQYDGKYVLTTDGSKDFGEIPYIERNDIILPTGKIRLPIGVYKNEKGDYGERHIERPGRLEELRQNGYYRARDLAEFVAKDFDAVYQGKGRGITLVKTKNKKTILSYTLNLNNQMKVNSTK
jgi:hypothetical protein